MITITMQEDFSLSSDSNIIPCAYSGNVPFKFVPLDKYKDYIIAPGYIYYNGSNKVEDPVYDYSDGLFTIPAKGFTSDGMLGISFSLTLNDKETATTEVCEFEIRESVNIGITIPKDDVWPQMLINFVDQYMTKVHDTVLKDLQEQAKIHQNQAVELQNEAKEQQSTTLLLQQELDDTIANLNENIESGEFVPNFKIGTVETGTTSKATITGPKKEPTLNITMQKGDKGDKGDIGVQGLKGDKGETGSQGIQGIKGDTGEKGEQGIQGLQGIQGIKGNKGDGVLVPHIVTELPATGETSDIYFLIKGDGYITYMWANNKWIILGSGDVDLSNFYTKLEIDKKINSLKAYDIESSENSLINTLDKIYKDQIKDVGDYAPIEKMLYLNISTQNASYNFMGLKNDTGYYMKMCQDIRRGNKGVLFTFMKFALESVDDLFLYVGQDSSYNLTETQHIVKNIYLKEVLDAGIKIQGKTSSDLTKDIVSVKKFGPTDIETSCILGDPSCYSVIQTLGNNRPRVMNKPVSFSDFFLSEQIAYVSDLDGMKLKKLTQAQYDALATKNANTLYLIVG